MGVSNSRIQVKAQKKSKSGRIKQSGVPKLKKPIVILEPDVQLLSGRKFWNENLMPYPFPIDWAASDTGFLQHITMKNILHGNYTASLEYHFEVGSKILDIGCGAGNWCIEMAQEFDDCMVYGIDLVPRFPTDIKPKNCEFIVGDILEPLPFEDNTLDYVYIRYLFAAIRIIEWPRLLAEVHRVLKPGGIFEHQEIDAVSHSLGPTYAEIQRQWINYFSDRGLDASYACRMTNFVAAANFSKIETKYISIPQGKWGGKLGEVWAESYQDVYVSLEAIGPLMIGLTHQEYDEKLKIMFEKEIDEYHTYSNHYIVLARKP